ncbi:amino acid adenylation domain-containing protein [Kitasatospora sp. HPMI-4]|uniref:amino acid adenylation domain-containing protein n=1 Tax=Kitasatospora sp. HPMI-4 TaxID=3448443 RepID=UPI003F1E16FC
MAARREFPLTAYQRDIWAAELSAPDDHQFNVIVQDRLDGPIALDSLRECLVRVLCRHEVFSLRFDERDGLPLQWVEETTPETASSWIDYLDLSGEDDPRAACAAWMGRSFTRPVPLRRSPLFRATLLRESPSVVHLHLKGHHILLDGWALDKVLGELWAEYARAVTAEDGPTAADAGNTAPRYLELLDSEAAYRGSAEYEQARVFHRERLEGVTPALFNRNLHRLPEGGQRSARHSFTVDEELVARIRKGGSSPFAFVAAAFATYLSRIHRADELVLGVPFLNRRTPQELATVGHFANNLPLRVAVPADATLRQLAAGIRASTDALREHERLPLGDILRDLPGGPTGDRRLFDVTLSYLRYARTEPAPGIELTSDRVAPVHRQHALSVVIHAMEDDSRLRIDLDYARDVFDRDFPIEAAAAHLLALIRNGVEEPERPAVTLPVLSEAEQLDLLAHRQGPDVAYPADRTLHSLIEEQAARTPDRIAVAATGSHPALGYAELDAGANQVARALRAEGVRPDDRVAVLMRRSPQTVLALLGVLKSGGAYVPVDPGYPAERIRFLLQDCGARVVLTGADSPVPEVDDSVRVLRVDELLDGPGEPLEPAADSHNLSYVIYTSGSTGRPKGVMVEHHSVVNRLAWMQRRYPVGEGDVLLQKTPISFDVSVWELFWWAIEGASLALLPVGGERDPRTILRTIAEQRVTVMHFVPSMLGPFLDLLEEEPGLVDQAASLRRVFCSGEALPAARVAQFNRVFGATGRPAPQLVNLYGPTEATVDVSYYDCPAEGVDRVPIGRPIDNTGLHVLDTHGNPQPVGVPGELCITGVGVARGYLDRPELTAEKFVDAPHLPGARMYRTGDLARRLADGNLEYLGRIDGQVKIRGNRVELGEVQNALASVDGVRDAVVVDRNSEARGTHLVGYYVAEEELDTALLRDRLSKALPEFMIPAYFVRIDRVPLTPNGKADRRALPDPQAVAGPSAQAAPRNGAEAALAAAWAEVLEVPQVGIHDNYFALGGDSILMLRVRAAAVRRGLDFSLSDLMRYPTVAELTPHTTTGQAAAEEPATEPFALVSSVDRARLEGRQDAYPVSRLQLGLLYHSRAQQDSAVYHDVFQYSLSLPWDGERFRLAFDRLVARHPALRSSFDLGSFSEPLQIVDAEVAGALEITDLRELDASSADAEIRRHVDERRYHQYEFERAPLYRLRVHLRPETVELVLSFHHAILDGGSVANLISELLQDYLHSLGLEIEAVADRALPSPARHVLAERQALESAEARAYWTGRFAGVQLPQLSAFRPHQPAGSDDLIMRNVELGAELTGAVRDFARERTLPVKSVLFAAHLLTLRLFSGSADVTTGLITHGRPEQAEAERIAGLFLNTVPIRLDRTGADWTEIVRETFRQEQESHPHRRYPLSAIQEDLGGTVLETAFNYVHFRQLAEVFGLPGVALLDFRTWEETNLRLLVNAVTDPTDGLIRLRIDYEGRTFTPDQAELHSRVLVDVLRRMVHHPDEQADFGFLAEEAGTPAGATATGSGLTTPSRTEVPAPDVVHAVRERIAHTPQAVALVADGQRWTYAELGRTAELVARRLIALGARPGDRVGIAMERSPETVAVILGVLMAGAAALPLDTGYPEERIAAMLEQARPFRVVAHGRQARLVTDGTPVLTAEELLAPADPGTEPESEAVVPPRIDPESTAYLLFTSGSTGRPKGVAMPHRSLANLVAWQNGIPSGAVGGTTVQYAPLSFDVSFQEIFSTLCGGGTLRLLTEEQRRDLPTLLRLLDREGVERLFLPYVALQQLAEASAALGIVPGALRVLISSGEQLRVTEEIRRLCAALPGAILENQYGPTESHVVASHTMSGDPADFPALPPIGTAITGARVLVLDARMRPVPPGVTGELYLGGACLAQGYFGQPELTAERFVQDPAGPAGERLYRTGDLGFTLPGGAVVCVGRADSQVKVRGFRVEPAEVEVAITRFAADHPGLSEVAVVARQREGNDSFLAAFLVGDPERADLVQLGKQLRSVLPGYLVPTHFEWLTALPLTPSGKRDDAALRRIPLTVAASADDTAPRDTYERTLATIIGDLLQRPSVGVHENLFELGGTSLTAMRLVVLIEQRYGISIPLSEFIAAPTVAELAGRLRSGGAQTAFDPLVPIRPGGAGRPVFFVHPMGGNVLCYVRFARYLPEGRPFYALQAAGADPGTEPLGSVEELAAEYISALRRTQPSGPYVIGGWSFGGFVAFEMARQLQAAGEEVEQLVLLDTTALNRMRRGYTDDDALLGWFFWELLWLQRGGDSPLEAIPAELTALDEKFDFIAQLAIAEGVLPSGSSAAVVRRLFRVYEANWRAAYAYRPDVVEQDMTLIHALEPLPEVLDSMHTAVGSMHQDPSNGWREWTSGELTVIDVPGDHLSIMEEPYVAHVAEVVADRIGQ